MRQLRAPLIAIYSCAPSGTLGFRPLSQFGGRNDLLQAVVECGLSALADSVNVVEMSNQSINETLVMLATSSAVPASVKSWRPAPRGKF